LRPILQSAGYFAYFWVILIALIFLTLISLKNNMIFRKINVDLPFQNSKPVESVSDFYDNIYDSYEKSNDVENDYQKEADSSEVTQAPK